MAGLSAPFRPASSSSQSFSSRLLLLLTVLPLTLALFAFMLQWRGGLDDPESRWPVDGQKFPGMENSPLGSSSSSSSPSLSSSSSSSDCLEILGRSSSPSFPYYRGVKSDFGSDPRPKVRLSGLNLKFWILCDPRFSWFEFVLIISFVSLYYCLSKQIVSLV